jgi:hypothetical protein
LCARNATILAAIVAAAAALCSASAHGAQLITNQGAAQVRLQVNARGEALLTYRINGKLKRVLVRGALGARQPARGSNQVEFELDYSGGWKTHHTTHWKTFPAKCARYDGPELPYVAAACKAPDGSYWVAQAWQQLLPGLGYLPWLPIQKAKWLFLSHWTGPVALIEAEMNWIYDGRWQQIFGRVTYRGRAVYGFGTTRYGVPTDGFGRIVSVDTHNSTYGNGWRRENASVTHNPTGLFCYGLSPHDPTTGGYRHPPGQTAPRGPGTGDKYRLTVNGPGVTPIVEKLIKGLHGFDASDPADVGMQVQQSAKLAAWGGRGERGDCSKGWFEP